MTTENEETPIVPEVVPTTQVIVSNQIVDGSLAPEDRTFRGAWQLEGNAITIDMEKARDIHRDALRAARKPELEALDTQWFRAAEEEDDALKADIRTKKQTLRDVTADPRIDAATTPEELKALTLEVLTG